MVHGDLNELPDKLKKQKSTFKCSVALKNRAPHEARLIQAKEEELTRRLEASIAAAICSELSWTLRCVQIRYCTTSGVTPVVGAN